MFYHTPSGLYVDEGRPFTLAGTQYPANWLNLSTPDDKAALGLVEVTTVGTREDDRTHWVSEELNGATRTIVNTPKSAEMIDEMRNAEALARIADLEMTQLRQMARMIRERTLKEAEDMAQAQFGVDPQQLYALGSQPTPDMAALNYKRLKDLDNDIKVERERLK